MFITVMLILSISFQAKEAEGIDSTVPQEILSRLECFTMDDVQVGKPFVQINKIICFGSMPSLKKYFDYHASDILITSQEGHPIRS